jgi:predicted dehydrogenase
MPSNALKVGLIGAGNVSLHHLRAYQQFPERLHLVAICDIHEQTAREKASVLGVEYIYTNPLEMLKKANIDAVDICTPHHLHASLAIAAAKAGKHILIEKPMASSIEQCHAMVEVARQVGVTLMVAQQQRFEPSYRSVHRIIQAGDLGKIYAARIDAMQNLRSFLPEGHWLYDGKLAGGGIVISLAVHGIDLLRYLVGEVTRVTAICKTMRSEFLNGAEDFACAIFEFENGAIGEMFATYSGFRIPWSESFMIFGNDGCIHTIPPFGVARGPALIATKASCIIEGEWNDQFHDFILVKPDYEELPTDDCTVNELLHFAECCQTGRIPISSGWDNLSTMNVVFGMYESARTKQPVEIAPL